MHLKSLHNVLKRPYPKSFLCILHELLACVTQLFTSSRNSSLRGLLREGRITTTKETVVIDLNRTFQFRNLHSEQARQLYSLATHVMRKLTENRISLQFLCRQCSEGHDQTWGMNNVPEWKGKGSPRSFPLPVFFTLGNPFLVWFLLFLLFFSCKILRNVKNDFFFHVLPVFAFLKTPRVAFLYSRVPAFPYRF